MIKDYHCHPILTQHPERMQEFVDTALKNGIEEICITDHMPLSFIPDGTDRIPHGKVPEYAKRLRETKEKYAGVISIKGGIEIDYHPSVTDEIEAVLDVGGFDYIIGSTHLHVFVKDLPNHTFNDYAALCLENEIRAIETGWFHVVPHMEMYRFFFAYPHRFPLVDDGFSLLRHEDLVKEVLRKAKERNMYIEINPNLARQMNDLGFAYPQAKIMEWAYETGNRFCYGSDAHYGEHIGIFLPEFRKSSVYGKAIAEWERD